MSVSNLNQTEITFSGLLPHYCPSHESVPEPSRSKTSFPVVCVFVWSCLHVRSMFKPQMCCPGLPRSNLFRDERAEIGSRSADSWIPTCCSSSPLSLWISSYLCVIRQKTCWRVHEENQTRISQRLINMQRLVCFFIILLLSMPLLITPFDYSCGSSLLFIFHCTCSLTSFPLLIYQEMDLLY